MKRLFDLFTVAVGVVLLSPALLLVALLVRLSSPGPVFFRQERIGRGGRPFFILKYRTMVQDASKLGRQITVGGDPRVTRIGRLLRKTKIDELPQLFNVLKGDMSLVGPRPEVRKYVEMFADDYEDILRVRPGITDFASIKFHDEEAILDAAADPEQEYIQRVLPEKIRLARDYVRRQSMRLDIAIIFSTLGRLFSDLLPQKGLKQSSRETTIR